VHVVHAPSGVNLAVVDAHDLLAGEGQEWEEVLGYCNKNKLGWVEVWDEVDEGKLEKERKKKIEERKVRWIGVEWRWRRRWWW